jgi:hypothetical protein
MTLDEREANAVMENKVRCVNLLLSCPLNRDASGCPFGKVRHEESVVTRVNWVKSLDAERLKGLLDRHEKCMGGKRNDAS